MHKKMQTRHLKKGAVLLFGGILFLNQAVYSGFQEVIAGGFVSVVDVSKQRIQAFFNDGIVFFKVISVEKMFNLLGQELVICPDHQDEQVIPL
jgi:hypothetical protein